MEASQPSKTGFQRGYITSSTAPVFGLGHNMGHFAPFVLGSTQLLHHFLGSKKLAKTRNDDVMY